MLKVTESEFYSTSVNTSREPTEKEHTPIDGYTMNKNVHCENCKYYSKEKYSLKTFIECHHEENNAYGYSFNGKIKNRIWSPEAKNKLRDCELYEQKKTVMQKIKINLGIEY